MNAPLDAAVIVVGGGPAGALSALLLAREGVDVLVLDRAAFPRAKPCGDCLSAEAGRLLARHDLLAMVLAAPHALLDGWRIHAPSGQSFAASFGNAPGGAFAIERRVFDHILLSAARAAGARVQENSKVISVAMVDGAVCGVTAVTTGSGRVPRTLRARFVIGADGLRSVVARRLGAVRRQPRVRKLSLTAHFEGALPFGLLGEMHAGDGICVGIAPVRASLDYWNVTVVADSSRFGRAVAEDAHGFFLAAVAGVPGCDVTPGELLSSGPFDVPTSGIAFPGAALVGDAAGYFDPFTGQGVYHGMRAAELLVSDLLPALAAGTRAPVLHGYVRAARGLMRGPRRLQKLIDVVMTRPALANSAVARLAQAPDAAQTLLDVTGDLVPVRRLLTPDVARDFIFPRPGPAGP